VLCFSARLFGPGKSLQRVFGCSFHGLFFVLCLFGFGLSPSSEKAREAGRPVGVVFRGHHVPAPC
jgi:hypothetical protein